MFSPELMTESFLNLPGTVAPDYQGNSLLNLVISLATTVGRARNSLFAAPSCEDLGDLKQARNTVFLIIDGMGAMDVARRGSGSFMSDHGKGRLTSVFPSTTACAVTTSLCGLAPAAHGLTGWYVRDDRFGGILAPLPMQRRDGLPLSGWWKMQRLFAYPSIFQLMKCRSVMVSHEHILGSPFNMRHSRGVARRYGYRSVDEMVATIVTAVRDLGSRGGFVHAYHADYDALAHAHGIGSLQCTEHFERLNEALNRISKALAGSDTALVVTADHGFIDSPPEQQVCLNDYPQLMMHLDGPLWGERRVAYARVRAGREASFAQDFAQALGDRFFLRRSNDIVDAGLFGPASKPNPRLRERVGDFTILGKGDWSIHDRVENERTHAMIGMHAGVSADEMLIPRVVAYC